ncbi:MAG: ABC transporter ATP-binding protein [Thermoanaerobacterales bacterium]|jgi:branched-chain amino acid transport system ATP-binding protein|nr:ABC transporter ATP-binding protein [Thermoanaerobacterales bacterium]
MLKVSNLQVKYGNITAVHDISFKVGKGQIVCLVGPNGAGKTTTMKTISGLLRPANGSINLEGQELTKMQPYEIAKLGLVPVPEGRRIFARLTVKENLIMGTFARKNGNSFSENFDRVMDLFPELKRRLRQYGGTLSGGEQQMLTIGRALMASPKIMIMDEPSMGLAPVIVNKIFKTIKEIQKEGTTILLVEQNANKALEIADYAYVIERGKIILEDLGSEMLKNEMVVKAYLGGNEHNFKEEFDYENQ